MLKPEGPWGKERSVCACEVVAAEVRFCLYGMNVCRVAWCRLEVALCNFSHLRLYEMCHLRSWVDVDCCDFLCVFVLFVCVCAICILLP